MEQSKKSFSSAEQLVQELRQRSRWIATAESCSGGLLAAAITDVSGSSEVFGYGLVTYSNQAKTELLQVPQRLLQEHGAVSKETAAAMTEGLLRLSGADLALSTTGIAGPTGGSTEKPVGLVYISCASPRGSVVEKHNFAGSREQVRQQTVQAALQLALHQLNELYPG